MSKVSMGSPSIKGPTFRISGHETFPCRYAWLPKVVRGLRENPKLFSDEADAMVTLGVGKNMVRSIRFWSQATGMATVLPKGAGHANTKAGGLLLGERGLDPFLEDIRTLWLIHWNLSTNIENPLLAWDYLLNRWHEPELVPSVVLKMLQKEAQKREGEFSMVTIEEHFDTFLHTYTPTRSHKGGVQEDNLDCPLVELEFLIKVGERELERSSGKREIIYGFRREEKAEITPELFLFCLNDFWQKRHHVESTLTLREVAHGHGSPGQIFKLPEDDIRARVETLARQTNGVMKYSETASQQHIQKHGALDNIALLNSIYGGE